VHVHRLRRKIEVNPNEPTYIVAERGTGYRFNTGSDASL
jgi:DNA-binding response OmpR family regulator